MDDELTVADLRSLFQAGGTAGATGSSAARSIDLAGNEAETAEALAQDAAFWRAQVAYNTRQVSREDAAAAINTLAAVERDKRARSLLERLQDTAQFWARVLQLSVIFAPAALADGAAAVSAAAPAPQTSSAISSGPKGE